MDDGNWRMAPSWRACFAADDRLGRIEFLRDVLPLGFLMPRRKRTEHPQIALYARVDSYDVRSSIGFNVFLLGRLRHDIAEDAEVFEASTQLVIRGTFSEPKERSGERIEVTLYGQKTGRTSLQVKDIHVRDKNHARQYRTYRDEMVPVLDLPAGLTTIQRRRDDRLWNTWIIR